MTTPTRTKSGAPGPKPLPHRTRATTTVRSKAMPDTPPNSIVTRSGAFMEPDERRARIAECAYYHAERRGFDPGHELDDWLTAEAEIDRMLTVNEQATLCG
jgi:Protein of unknown function (DUF2934)